MAPRPDVSEERKDQILDAATDVFAEKGFNEARMDDIVEESGLSKGTLYWYFKSKDEIILSIFERIFAREFAELENLVNAEGTARGVLAGVPSCPAPFHAGVTPDHD